MKLLNDDLHEPLGRSILCRWVEALCFTTGRVSFCLLMLITLAFTGDVFLTSAENKFVAVHFHPFSR